LATTFKRLPDLQVLLALLKTCSAAVPTTTSSHSSSPAPEHQAMELIYERTLRLLRYYQRFFPEAFVKARFDVGKCLPPNLSSCSIVIRTHLLHLLLGAGSNLQWTAKST